MQFVAIHFTPFEAGEKFGRSGRLGGHATGEGSRGPAR
jgi:hypothetical protein